MSGKVYAYAVFDRKKEIAKRGVGKVEIRITLSRKEMKCVTVAKCSALEWRDFKNSPELEMRVAMYNDIANQMAKLGEEMTIENFNAHLEVSDSKEEKKKKANALSSPTGFLDFMREHIKKEKNAPKTLDRKNQVIRYLEDFGRIKRFCDVHVYNIVKFNDWLDDGTRELQSIYNYHKVLKKYVRLAYQEDFIPSNPYKDDKCKFKRGKSKERVPLLEEELLRIRALEDLTNYECKARDIFVFQAYTGLSYADAQKFEFETMTVLCDGTYFIDGSRLKTGSNFFTPILPPAIEVLKKYDYKVPKISNQKLNEYLHIIQRHAKIGKSMTSHVARHSFASLTLDYDVPVYNLSRMLGHKDIKTTMIYAHLHKKNVKRHGQSLSSEVK